MIENTDTYPITQSGEHADTSTNSDSSFHGLRIPTKADGAAIHRLIQQCPPLDLNSIYTYLLLSEHFSQTCVIAGAEGAPDGFVSAYMPPGRSDTLFIWQVAVHSRARGRGLGGRMLDSLLERPALAHIQFLETTVGPDNAASRGMFAGLARRRGAPTHETALFNSELFGDAGHDDERLIRIGPLTNPGHSPKGLLRPAGPA